MLEPMHAQIGRNASKDSPSEVETIREEVLEALKSHPTFRAAAVEVEGLRPSARGKGTTEGWWSAMDSAFGVLSGTLVIDWADADHMSGSMTVHVGSSGLW